jgi:hypothetical protein
VPRAASRARDGLSVLIAILTLVLVAVVVVVVSAPLRSASRRQRPGSSGGPASGRPADRSELEAAREAKYREIRDAELDYRTGKLSREDYGAIDGELRAEAIEILDRIEAEDR